MTNDCIYMQVAFFVKQSFCLVDAINLPYYSVKRRINEPNSLLTEFILLGESGSVNVTVIVGGVLGATVVLLIILLLVIFGRKVYPTLRAKQRKEQQKEKVIVE